MRSNPSIGRCNDRRYFGFEHKFDPDFRTHWELFPNTRDLTPELVDELRDIALHAAAGPSN